MHKSFSDLGFEALEDVLQLTPPSKDALAQLAQDAGETRTKRANADEADFFRSLGVDVTEVDLDEDDDEDDDDERDDEALVDEEAEEDDGNNADGE